MNTQQHSLIIVIALLLISTLITGCDVIFGGGGPAATEAAKLQADLLARATQTAVAAAQLTAAAKPTLTFTPVPSNTPTNTPAPTHTPTLTATPTSVVINAGMNQRVVLGNIAINVIAAKFDSRNGTSHVAIVVENLGKEPVNITATNFAVTTSDGKTIPTNAMPPAAIAAGGRASIVPNFNVVPAAKPVLLYRSTSGIVYVLLNVQ